MCGYYICFSNECCWLNNWFVSLGQSPLVIFKSSLLLLDKGRFFLLIFVQMTPLRGFRRKEKKKANESRCRDIMASLKTVNSVCNMYRTKQQHYQQRWLPSLYCCCYSVTFAITWLQNDHAYQIVIFSWQTPVSWSTFFLRHPY